MRANLDADDVLRRAMSALVTVSSKLSEEEPVPCHELLLPDDSPTLNEQLSELVPACSWLLKIRCGMSQSLPSHLPKLKERNSRAPPTSPSQGSAAQWRWRVKTKRFWVFGAFLSRLCLWRAAWMPAPSTRLASLPCPHIRPTNAFPRQQPPPSALSAQA